jgi:LysR family transcriptional regulator, glycine cleavage system transcriptional activator
MPRQAFEAAARLSSFALAAEELFVTPSAVSHQIKLLEDQLGVWLFHRVHRAVVLTDTGRQYAEEIGAAFARIDKATRDIGRVEKSDILTVHATPSTVWACVWRACCSCSASWKPARWSRRWDSRD